MAVFFVSSRFPFVWSFIQVFDTMIFLLPPFRFFHTEYATLCTAYVTLQHTHGWILVGRDRVGANIADSVRMFV